MDDSHITTLIKINIHIYKLHIFNVYISLTLWFTAVQDPVDESLIALSIKTPESKERQVTSGVFNTQNQLSEHCIPVN